MWKTLTVITILLAGAGAVFRYFNTESAKLEAQLLERSDKNKAAVTEHLDAMGEEITTNVGQAKDTNDEAEQEAGKLETARTQLADKEAMKTDIEGQIEAKKTKLADLKEKTAEFGEIEDLVAKADSLELERVTVEQELLSASETFKGLVATRSSTEAKIASLEDRDDMVKAGKMKAINAKVSQSFGDWNFVVINAGANQGVNARTLLDVMSGGDVIAKLQVTNLESDVAVCDVINVLDGQSVSTGDRVVVAEESKWDPKKAAAEAAAAAAALVPGAAVGGAAAPAPAPAPAGDAGDPFGLDPAPGGAAPTPAGDDPFGLGVDTPDATPKPEAPDAEADPFGLDN